MIRALCPGDIDTLRVIHHNFYRGEFEFPDFLNNFLCSFVVIKDGENKIVSAGGVRLIAEAIIITDKQFSVRERRSALYQILDAAEFITKKADFPRLHAVTEDESWKKHLMKIGFHSRGELLVLDL